MRRKDIYCVRLVGTPAHRRYIVQRSDGKFWGSAGRWVAAQRKALVYRTIADAQAVCRPLIARQTRGLPRRQFACTLAVNVIGCGTRPVTAEDVADYLRRVLVIGIDFEVLPDGPLADHQVEVQARLCTMAEASDGEGVRQ